MNVENRLHGIHKDADNLAFSWYIRKGYVPPALKKILDATASMDAFLKYNPQQPRVPAGNPEGGQWAGGSGGSSVDDIDDPPLEPVYPVEYLVAGLARLTARATLSAIEIVIGVRQSINSTFKIRRAAQAIEDYFGGKPDRTERNAAGDLFMMKSDKKIRFDINNQHPHNEPHFHIEKMVPKTNKRGEDWIAVDKNHHFYPLKKE
jgi:hypothetical protein